MTIKLYKLSDDIKLVQNYIPTDFKVITEDFAGSHLITLTKITEIREGEDMDHEYMDQWYTVKVYNAYKDKRPGTLEYKMPFDIDPDYIPVVYVEATKPRNCFDDPYLLELKEFTKVFSFFNDALRQRDAYIKYFKEVDKDGDKEEIMEED